MKTMGNVTGKVTGKDVRRYEETISHSGLRLTPQRRHVYDALLTKRDHPTATEVFMRVKKNMSTISLATVYNCLETLVDCGLVKQVNVDRQPTRFCPNLKQHGHFICDACGMVVDVDLVAEGEKLSFAKVPDGFQVTSAEVNLRGLCAGCNHNN